MRFFEQKTFKNARIEVKTFKQAWFDCVKWENEFLLQEYEALEMIEILLADEFSVFFLHSWEKKRRHTHSHKKHERNEKDDEQIYSFVAPSILHFNSISEYKCNSFSFDMCVVAIDSELRSLILEHNESCGIFFSFR